MNCNDTRRWISDRIDGVPRDARAADAEEHLTRCDACRAEHRALARLDEVMRASPEPQAPSRLIARVTRTGPVATPRRRMPILPLSLAAAAAVVVCAVVIAQRGDGRRHEAARVAPTRPPEEPTAPQNDSPPAEEPAPVEELTPSRTPEAPATADAQDQDEHAALDATAFEAVEALRRKFAADGPREDVADALDRAELFLELTAAHDEDGSDLADVRDQIREAGLVRLFANLAWDPCVADDPAAKDAATDLAMTLRSIQKGS